MVLSFLKKYMPVFVCLGLAIFLLSKMLLPGYVLTLDMAWTPEIPYAWSADGLNNSILVYVLLHVLSLAMPSWVVQKVLLVGLFFLLFYIPWKFLPFVEGTSARIFAAGIFALNPFVYTRVLAGQWFHLLGYAFLPLLLYALTRISHKPDRRSAAILFGALFLIGLFSIHFLYLACVVSGIWLAIQFAQAYRIGGAGSAKRIARFSALAGIWLLVANLYWIIPAAARSAPLEARFGETYFSAFAAAGNDGVGVMANVGVLGGFWGESLPWRYYFVWPQDQVVFWVAAFVIFALVWLGLWRLWNKKETRPYALALVVIGIFAYITALGMAGTLFKYLNLFLYEHIPFWNGLRDSHKIAGILALMYAVCAGVGASAFLATIKKKNAAFESFASMAILVFPAIFGMYMWGGMHGQLTPVWYPQGWYEAKSAISQLPQGEKVLVLPWHGYLSLDFAQNRIVANPTEAFFGQEHIVSGRGVEFGKIRDQEVDAEYRDMDAFLLEAEKFSPQMLVAGLKERGISRILIIVNPAIPSSEEGLTRWKHFSAEIGDAPDTMETKTWVEMLPVETTTLINSDSVVLKGISL